MVESRSLRMQVWQFNQVSGESQRGVECSARLHETTDQTHLQGFRSRNWPTGEYQIHGSAMPDQTRKADRPHVDERNAEAAAEHTQDRVTFPAFIPRPPTFTGVHCCTRIRSDLVFRPYRSVENRPDRLRDAEVAGLNPAVPTNPR